MKKIFDFYLVLIISVNMLLALTIVCAPHSSMRALEELFSNSDESTMTVNTTPPGEAKQIQIVGNTTGTIEFNR